MGILLLIAGVAYPMGAVYWINQRLGRKPALTPRQLALIVAFNGILPVSLVFWGLAMMVRYTFPVACLLGGARPVGRWQLGGQEGLDAGGYRPDHRSGASL